MKLSLVPRGWSRTLKRVGLIAPLLIAFGGSSLWAEHWRFPGYYGPGGFYPHRVAGHHYYRPSPYGFGFGGFYGPGYNRGYGFAGRYVRSYHPGFTFTTRGYPARYYTQAAYRGTYSVYLGPSNPATIVRANYSDLIFDVTPAKALVYVNGSLIGSARSFATFRNRFPIIEGEHQLRIEYPGYQVFETTLQVVPDRNLHIDVQLQPAGSR